MPKLTIDGRNVEVADGATLLDAARHAGIEIPTLCHAPGIHPLTSCMVCVVKETSSGRMLPACSAKVQDGMVVETMNDEIRAARREVIELLMSEHVGDCEAPCKRACPASMNIPLMLRLIKKGDMAAAAGIARRDLVMPATLGWVCKAPCEKGCRRAAYDEAISIRDLHRRAAEGAIENGVAPPVCDPATGRKVAVVGAGPAGLAAASILRRHGHAAQVFEKEEKPGGRFRYLPDDELPKRVLDAEIDLLCQMGVTFETGCEIGAARSFRQLKEEYDAVIVTAGEYKADVEGVFTVKAAVAPVRAVANGKAAAGKADGYLGNGVSCMNGNLYNSRVGRMDSETLDRYVVNRVDETSMERSHRCERPEDESARCFHCDCRSPISCKLRQYATDYGAKPDAHGKFERMPLEIVRQSAGVLFESGKCIRCGLCIEITRRDGEQLGLTFVGRGFNVRVAVPLGGTLEQGLGRSARRCVETCPTGALAFPDQEERDPCE